MGYCHQITGSQKPILVDSQGIKRPSFDMSNTLDALSVASANKGSPGFELRVLATFTRNTKFCTRRFCLPLN